MKLAHRILGNLTISAVVVGVALTIKNCTYDGIYKNAEPYAIHNIGDKQHPLTKTERQEWYHQMNIGDNRQPTKEDLNKFLDGKVK